jgi:hypothetical protein
MGLLDDAIREHLDLKRRRGADPAEIERAERDALGPVRRGPEEPEPPELLIDEGHAYEELEGADWDEDLEEDVPASDSVGQVYDEPERAAPTRTEPVDDDRFRDEDRFRDDDPFAEEDRDRPGHAEPAADHDVTGHDELMAEDDAAAPHRAPSSREGLGETVEYDVAEAFEDEGLEPDPTRPAAAAPHADPRGPESPRAAKKPGEADEDVLEETPEFLQDTPDHDRLWFEQKPPRDFDFDG